MAVTQVSIANRALVLLGADRISSITQDTRAAVLVNAIYDHVRDVVSVAHPWNCLIKRVTLAPNATTPDFGYDYQYDVPSDCLRILIVNQSGNPDNVNDVDWVVESNGSGSGQAILCDETTLNVLYIQRNTDESSWSYPFTEAFIYRLASELAYGLTQSLPLRQEMFTQFQRVISEARSLDGAEGIIRGFQADTWTDERK